ncbi:MAG TPA: allantoinase AllB [Solirubrobacteraceae bacterium]|nr:allantoinase AllB [Solirubrobacteraceae bacterium]
MTDLQLVVRGARLASGEPVDIGVDGGRIAAIEPQIDAAVGAELDAHGLLALPGGVDPHVHFNEPGLRSHWEGWATGSAAAAAGGLTTVIEMPLNAHPPTVDVEAFDAKRAAGERASHVDFGLWGGVVPGNLAQLKPLAQRGVMGFKAFMSASGVDDFPTADAATLYDAMAVIGQLDLPLLVHAEGGELTRTLTERARAAGRVSMRDYLATSPAVAEAEAVARAIELAHATGCRLHIVHVSTARAVELVLQGRAAGVDVTCEVTAHHLLLDEDDAVRLGAVAKCAPPLRPRAEPAHLWELLNRRAIGFVVSDHSPAPPELKREDDLLDSWGGISGVQSTIELMLGDERLGAGLAAEVLAGEAARRFRLAGKGMLAVGADADIALVQVGHSRTLSVSELRYRHPQSPYVGRRLTARVRHTLLRGEPVTADAPPRGRFQKPSR